MERVSLIREIVITLAAITGSVVAVYGMYTWKSQLRGKTEYELARRLMRSVFRVRDSLQRVRSPLMSGEEMAAALKEKGIDMTALDEKDAIKRGRSAAYEVRCKEVTTAASELELEALEAEVLWGNTIRQRYRELNQFIISFFVDLSTLLDEESDMEPTELRKIRRRIFRGGKDDSFSDELNGIIKTFEEFLQPKLKL